MAARADSSSSEKRKFRPGAKRCATGPVESLRLAVDAGVVLLVVWGLVVVCAERGNWALAASAAVVAAGAFWLTDYLGRFSLPRPGVNAGIVLAGIVLVVAFAYSRGVRDTLDAAKMLALIQLPLLWERKSARTRWDLLTLSALQVCLAAGVSQSLMFGVLLIVYLLLGSCLLALLCQWREQTAGRCTAMAGLEPGDMPLRTDWGRLRKIALATLVVGPASLFFRFAEETNGQTPPGGLPPGELPQERPPGGGREPLARNGSAGVDERKEQMRVFRSAFWTVLLLVSFGGFLIGGALFVVLPRWGPLAVGLPRLGALPWNEGTGQSTGFSDRVELGQLGRLIDNPEEVFTAEFRTYVSNEPYRPSGSVYFRGSVLTDYTNGGWNTGPSSSRYYTLPQVERLTTVQHVVRQHIAMKPASHNRAFCVWPVVLLRKRPRLRFNWRQECFERPRDLQRRGTQFELGTTAFENQVQSILVPAAVPINMGRLLTWPREKVPSAARLARQWMAQAAVRPSDAFACARLLARQLRESGMFEYSKQAVERNAELDPIEDFLSNHRRGHCEYFASALAIALRSQGIPSRIVVGYKCDEFDYFGRFFRVRQSHAHAWVEAYLGPEQLPANLPGVFGPDEWKHGGWLRLDPTPSATTGAFSIDALAQGMRSWIDQLRTFWTVYVVGLDSQRQRELIFRPLLRAAETAWHTAAAIPGRIAQWAATLARSTSGDTSPRWAYRVGQAVAIALLLGLLLLLPAIRKKVLRWWLRIVGRLGIRPAQRDSVEFYRQMERLLGRLGLRRRRWQTQREFAAQAATALRQNGDSVMPEDGLTNLAEAFYRVRFGKQSLEEIDRRRVEATLDSLAGHVRRRPPKRGETRIA